jgi:hypothetical protein
MQQVQPTVSSAGGGFLLFRMHGKLLPVVRCTMQYAATDICGGAGCVSAAIAGQP